MNILAHRGYWLDEGKKNSAEALKAALELGYGLETDIRDYKGTLVISHNVADADSPSVEDLFSFYSIQYRTKWLALNVKADGIQPLLIPLLKKYNISKYFLFDMSVPELVVNKRENLNFYTRHSDIESECVCYETAMGVWIDCFYDKNWLDCAVVAQHLRNGKHVCIVSPELHQNDNFRCWGMLKENGYDKNNMVSLCTDVPDLARRYFDEG